MNSLASALPSAQLHTQTKFHRIMLGMGHPLVRQAAAPVLLVAHLRLQIIGQGNIFNQTLLCFQPVDGFFAGF